MWPLIYDHSGIRCIKYSLITFSVLFILTGMTLIIIGSTIDVINNEFSYFLSDGFYSPATLLLFVGFIIFVMAILGCTAAFKESTCLIMTFGMLLGVTALIQVGVGITANSLITKIDEKMQNKLNTTINDYNENPEAKEALDNLQKELHCCGVNGPKDWEQDKGATGYWSLPTSCCLTFDNDSCENVANIGCRYVLKLITEETSKILITSSYLLAFMEGFGMFFSFYLGKLLRQQKLARDYRKWLARDNVLNSKIFPAPGKDFQDFPSMFF